MRSSRLKPPPEGVVQPHRLQKLIAAPLLQPGLQDLGTDQRRRPGEPVKPFLSAPPVSPSLAARAPSKKRPRNVSLTDFDGAPFDNQGALETVVFAELNGRIGTFWSVLQSARGALPPPDPDRQRMASIRPFRTHEPPQSVIKALAKTRVFLCPPVDAPRTRLSPKRKFGPLLSPRSP